MPFLLPNHRHQSTEGTYFCCIFGVYILSHKHQICSTNTVQNCLRPNFPISFHRGPDTWMCHSVGNQMVEVTKPNRNRKVMGNRKTNNIKISVENASLCGKICDMHSLQKYAKNVAQSEIWSNRMKHIRIKMTCLKLHVQYISEAFIWQTCGWSWLCEAEINGLISPRFISTGGCCCCISCLPITSSGCTSPVSNTYLQQRHWQSK